jgi:uncharacterized SAM-binding protein YcdF (DUF218 family)
VKRTGTWLAVTALVTYAASVGWVWFVSRQDQRVPVDAIVVLGAAHYNGRPSPVLRARVDHGLQLLRARLAPRIVVTGGTHPGDTESEAEVGRRYLAAAGVANSAVVALSAGQTTEETMTAVGTWSAEHHVRSVLLVSDGFHLARLRLEAARLGLRAKTTPAPMSPITPGSPTEFLFFLREGFKLPVALFRSLIKW